MNIQQYIKLGLTATLLSALSTQAQANSCGDESPLLEKLGSDGYTQMVYSPEDTGQLVTLDKNDLLTFLERSKLRSGKGVRHRCVRGETPETTTFKLNDINRVETAKGDVILTAWEESRRATKSAKFELPSTALWNTNANGAHSTSQVFQRVNAVGTNLGYSNASIGGRRTQMAEITLELHRSASGIRLVQTFYTQGRKTEWVTWDIDR